MNQTRSNRKHLPEPEPIPVVERDPACAPAVIYEPDKAEPPSLAPSASAFAPDWRLRNSVKSRLAFRASNALNLRRESRDFWSFMEAAVVSLLLNRVNPPVCTATSTARRSSQIDTRGKSLSGACPGRFNVSIPSPVFPVPASGWEAPKTRARIAAWGAPGTGVPFNPDSHEHPHR